MKKFNFLIDSSGHPILGFNSEWTLDVESNKFKKIFIWDGKKCPSYEISWGKSEQLGRYSLIQKDIKQLIKMASIAEDLACDRVDIQTKNYGYFFDTDDEMALIIKALYISLVITYGKCFASAKGRRIKLDKDAVFNKNNKHLEVLHEQLIEARNQYVAHGGNTNLESFSVSLIFQPNLSQKTTPMMSVDSYYVNSISKGSFKKYKKLFEHLNNFVVDKMRILSEKIYDEHIINNIDALYKNLSENNDR